PFPSTVPVMRTCRKPVRRTSSPAPPSAHGTFTTCWNGDASFKRTPADADPGTRNEQTTTARTTPRTDFRFISPSFRNEIFRKSSERRNARLRDESRIRTGKGQRLDGPVLLAAGSAALPAGTTVAAIAG